MNVTINGWNCQMSVREFVELAQTMKAAEPAPVPVQNPEKVNLQGALKNGCVVKMLDGEHHYFLLLRDLAVYFPELDENALTGFVANGIPDYLSKQAVKVWGRLNPENKFSEFTRYTTTGKAVTAKMNDRGECIGVEVEENTK